MIPSRRRRDLGHVTSPPGGLEYVPLHPVVPRVGEGTQEREREKKSKLIFSSRLDGVFCRLTSACTMYSNNDRYPHTDTGVPPSTLLAQMVALSFFFLLRLEVSSLLERLYWLVGWYVCVCEPTLLLEEVVYRSLELHISLRPPVPFTPSVRICFLPTCTWCPGQEA